MLSGMDAPAVVSSHPKAFEACVKAHCSHAWQLWAQLARSGTGEI